jgi:phospholipase C
VTEHVTRRDLLKAGLVGGIGLGLAGCTGSGSGHSALRRATAARPAGSDLGAVDHVVMLMQENRSFDHYFGTLRGVRGFDDHPSRDLGAFSQSWPSNRTKPPRQRLLPFHLDTATTDAECTFDLSHAWTAQHQCWNHGKLDAWVTTHTSAQFEGPANGVLTMGYYTRSDIPFYYALAEAFTIGDAYHCSVLGPTHPNRLFWVSGTNDPGGRAGGPVIITNESPEAQFSVSWSTMPEALEDAGVSWKVYNPPGSPYQPSNPDAIIVSNNIFLYFKQYSDQSSPLHQKAFLPTYPADFARDVSAGTLPQVSWLVAPTLVTDFSEHPPAPAPLGEWFTSQVLDTLASNPAVWSKTVLFLSYDENDGFFDHVPPPTPPAGTSGEYLTVDPLPADAGGVAGPTGLGFRVPLLVLSPFSRGGHIYSQTSDHTSQLRFIETRFGVRVPNLSSWRRGVTSDLSSSLSMGSSKVALPNLPPTSSDDPRVARECKAPQLAEIDVPGPPYPLPPVQKMPVQEA